MIKYETIISNFDDKVTLYNWLRKVEEALKNASATNFVVNKKGNATLSFSITFADGTTLESGDIVLQQGESVDDARIASGILQLHLTNGTWLTAGNIKPVSNFEINASQHLIVNYQDGTSQDLGAIFNGNITISGNFAVTGDANVVGTMDAGKVTGNEIVEKMSGYQLFTQTPSRLTLEYIYASAVKNGNKLTLVGALNITRTDEIQTSFSNIMLFVLPSAIQDKLYPVSISGHALLTINKVTAVDTSMAIKEVTCIGSKHTYGIMVSLAMADLNELTLNEKYYVRYEATLLLSDNLIN